jgi:hypothetical protein
MVQRQETQHDWDRVRRGCLSLIVSLDGARPACRDPGRTGSAIAVAPPTILAWITYATRFACVTATAFGRPLVPLENSK